ncbi:MAG: PEGA domain-containing protein [Deltaproteobacteria bacterium]|nr:PEGA domain-containing protein [Deltaproteobacteria bacterium]
MLVPCLLLATVDAHGDDKYDAQKHFKAGVSLQKVEDFEAAIAAFESSLRLYPSKGAMFNLANCLRATHRYGEALKVLQRLDLEYGRALDPAMRAAVDRQLEELRNLTAALVVQVDQAGAEVMVDGKVIGHTPLPEELWLSPGSHTIEVRLEGYEPAKVQVELVPREQTTRQITLEQATSAPAPPPPDKPQPDGDPAPEPPLPPPDEGTGPLTTAGWITGAVGLAALAGGAVTGIWALSVDGDLADACTDGNCPVDRGTDIDRLDTLTTTTNVLLPLGATFTAAGIVMLLVDQPTSPRSDDAPRLGLSLGPGLFGIAMGGRF